MDTTTPSTLTKVMLSVNDFCKAAGIGRSLFYAEMRSGRLKVKKCGNRTLIPTAELEAWSKRLPSPDENQAA